MLRACNLRQKEVINVKTAEKLGYIRDVEINFETGIIDAVIVPKRRSVFSLFQKNREYVILWRNIVKIGSEIVLVNCEEE